MTLKSRLVRIKDLCNNAVYFLATHFISAFDVRTKLSKIRTERDRSIFKMKFHFLVQNSKCNFKTCLSNKMDFTTG